MDSSVERERPLAHYRSELADLVDFALAAGATAAAEISASDVVVDDALAAKCMRPRCENYGKSRSCPPYVKGPQAFREKLAGFSSALVIAMEVPTAILLSSDALVAFQLLNKVATDLERAAVARGFKDARAYTAGGCKKVFCREHEGCLALGEGGKCRNPLYARESMSGYGVDVAKLAGTAGWTLKRAIADGEPVSGEAPSVYALVLVR